MRAASTVRALIGPGDDRGAVLIGEPSFGMDDDVVPWRHLALIHGFNRLLELLPSLVRVIPLPGRKVHVFAALVDVVSEQPRDRCDAAIPGPDRFVAVTVKACTFSDLTCLRTISVWLFHYGRIGMVMSIGNHLN